MRVIEQKRRIEVFAELQQMRNISEVAVHRIHAVADDEAQRRIRFASTRGFQQCAQLFGIGIIANARAVSFGEAARVDNRSVIAFIAKQIVAALHQRADRSQIGGESAGKNQRRLALFELRQRAFQFLVRRAVFRRPAAKRARRRHIFASPRAPLRSLRRRAPSPDNRSTPNRERPPARRVTRVSKNARRDFPVHVASGFAEQKKAFFDDAIFNGDAYLSIPESRESAKHRFLHRWE